MSGRQSVVVKNVLVKPEKAPNDGQATIVIDAVVFTAEENASIDRVVVDFSPLGGDPLYPMYFIESQGLTETKEGAYRCTFDLPLLADPGQYRLMVQSDDTRGSTGRAYATLQVEYKHPGYKEIILSHANQFLLDRVSGCKRIGGNRIAALTSGNAAMQQRMSLIEKASQQINLQAYTLSAEGLCGRMLDAVLDRAVAGIEVNLLINLGSQMAVSPTSLLRVGLQKVGKDLQGLAKQLEEALESKQGLGETIKEVQEIFQGRMRRELGINFILVGEEAIFGLDKKSPPPGQRSHKWLDQLARNQKELDRNDPSLLPGRKIGRRRYTELPSLPLLTYGIHEKIMVVDGTYAIVGGRNLEDRYFKHWIDTDLYLEGPVVGMIQKGFLRNWESFAQNLKVTEMPAPVSVNPPETGGMEARFVQSRPWMGEYHTMETLVTAFQLAQKRILISSQYLVLPQSLLRETLVDAARRGVDVRILTNSDNTGQEVGFSAGHSISMRYYQILMDAGIRIYEMIGPEEDTMPKPYLHAKEFLVDGIWGAIGSFNLSMRSCFIESENIVVIQNADFVQAREAAFMRLLEDKAEEMTVQSLEVQKERFCRKMTLTQYLDLFF